MALESVLLDPLECWARGERAWSLRESGRWCPASTPAVYSADKPITQEDEKRMSCRLISACAMRLDDEEPERERERKREGRREGPQRHSKGSCTVLNFCGRKVSGAPVRPPRPVGSPMSVAPVRDSGPKAGWVSAVLYANILQLRTSGRRRKECHASQARNGPSILYKDRPHRCSVRLCSVVQYCAIHEVQITDWQ